MGPPLLFNSNSHSKVGVVVQMLNTLPDIRSMFRKASYEKAKKECVAGEISRILKSKIRRVSAANLEAILNGLCSSADFDLEKLDLGGCFRLIYAALKGELEYWPSSQELLAKFKLPQSKDCNKCESEMEILKVSPIEGSVTTEVRRLINAKSLKMRESVACTSCRLHNSTSLPDYLIVQIDREKANNGSCIFADNTIKVLNEDSYKLRCIVDLHPDTGKYLVSVVNKGVWMTCDGAKLSYGSKEDVKTKRNYMFLYEKQTEKAFECPFPECNIDSSMVSQEEFSKHMRERHPTCPKCKKTFSLRQYLKEHLKKSECATEDSGVDTMSDSSVVENFPDKKSPMKRKPDGDVLCPSAPKKMFKRRFLGQHQEWDR